MFDMRSSFDRNSPHHQNTFKINLEGLTEVKKEILEQGSISNKCFQHLMSNDVIKNEIVCQLKEIYQLSTNSSKSDNKISTSSQETLK